MGKRPYPYSPLKIRRANERLTMTSGMKTIYKNQMEVVENSEFFDKELGYVLYILNGLCWKEKFRSIYVVYQILRDKASKINFRMMHCLRHCFGSTHTVKALLFQHCKDCCGMGQSV